MRQARRVVHTIVVVTALSAIASATASAALPEFSKTGVKFTGNGKATTLETVGGSKIECPSDTESGEITGPKTGTITVDFKGCKALGFAANSLGDAKETILYSGSLELCYINKAAKVVGLKAIISTPVHVEVPALGTLLSVAGNVVGEITPINTESKEFTWAINEAKGVPSQICEGGKAELTTSKNEGANEGSGLKNTNNFNFGVNIIIIRG